ncbi:hypothetical protein BCL90_0817 [Pedobacter alluvionis]|uniref:Uncharacterized protein n=1 Tax=Pedobacter alluvionis TaxID=475253 RepID=A0A497YB30_9SPHI|nr:hypothetical protein BCL90_0817 [Pedobacter alluvionis]
MVKKQLKNPSTPLRMTIQKIVISTEAQRNGEIYAIRK